ncbi:MAG: SocA family protein [Prevotellaceae bacterium]|nr:SocA family protein [Prevotellaceae bacterium]
MFLMSLFNKDVTLNAVLYITEKSGGKADMHKIFKTLYFADREHLCKYGRSITGDFYRALQYGPVPSNTSDIFRAIRGDSFFAYASAPLQGYFHFVNKYIIAPDKKCDKDYLSDTDIECLDFGINICKDLSLSELTELSHGLAWQNTAYDKEMSVGDILRENGDTDEYAEYISGKLRAENAFLCGTMMPYITWQS